MNLKRLGPRGSEIPVVCTDRGETFSLRPITDDIHGTFLANDGINEVRRALRTPGLLPPVHDADNLRIGSPVARPSAVICIGQNFAAHAAESGNPPPSVPIMFFKHPNTVVGPYDDVRIPPGAQKVDWEVELAVIIGKQASYLQSDEQSLEYVAGYSVSNDVSERAYQIEISGGQWSKGKTASTFNPFGPCLVPSDEIADVQNLRLWSRVNGEARQDSNTADMIFSVARLVYELSQFLVLEPGDILNTGTPQGVALSGRFPYLTDGDVVELGIDGLGTQRQLMVSTTFSNE